MTIMMMIVGSLPVSLSLCTPLAVTRMEILKCKNNHHNRMGSLGLLLLMRSSPHAFCGTDDGESVL